MFEPGGGVLYMKVGTHAQEDLAQIIQRKKQEIDAVGYSLWGYGGNTCHPRTMVQPFAAQYAARGKPIVLAMQPMKSRHFAEPLRADESSIDGINWTPIPDDINVLGSRYALCLRTLEEIDEELYLPDTRVAVGNSKGMTGDRYVRGRVDKACLEVASFPNDPSRQVKIPLVAELVEPFAVFLR
jgi:hypothetical protein